MWWADFGGSAIQATTTGAVPATAKVTDTTAAPQGIAAGPGTQMAFGAPEQPAGPGRPRRRRRSTRPTPAATPASASCSAQDGAYWAPRFAARTASAG